MEDTANKKRIEDLLSVMAALRTPETGCPWDLEQDFASIAPYTIEEAYEVADAIARGDLADLKDELGDLLLQVIYHARMAEEIGAFDFADVTGAIVAKMVRRHPHVFGNAEERAAGAAKGFWERIKAEEKAEKADARAQLATGAASPPHSPASSAVLGDVPVGLPGLTRAVKLQAKAARVGFDWPSLAPVFDKMREELAEFEEVALPADPRGDEDRVRGADGPSRSPARDNVPGPDYAKN
jgi:MazG family protein